MAVLASFPVMTRQRASCLAELAQTTAVTVLRVGAPTASQSGRQLRRSLAGSFGHRVIGHPCARTAFGNVVVSLGAADVVVARAGSRIAEHPCQAQIRAKRRSVACVSTEFGVAVVTVCLLHERAFPLVDDPSQVGTGGFQWSLHHPVVADEGSSFSLSAGWPSRASCGVGG